MMPSASDLSYFIEIAATLNLSRAAERLGLSQPSLSLAIQRLEHSIGTPLLIRGKQGVSLTQAGKQLQLHAKELSQRWEEVKGRALASVKEIQGSYSLGCHPSVGIYSLGGFLPDLLERHPKLEIRLRHGLSREITESVIRLETDVGIVVNPVKHPDLAIRKLCDDHVGFWTGAGRRKTQDLTSGEAIIVCDPELQQTQALLKRLLKGGLRYRRVLASSNLEVIARLTDCGAGVGVLPGRVAASAGHGRLRRVEAAPAVRDEICVLYRAENRPVRSIQAICDGAAAFLAETGARAPSG